MNGWRAQWVRNTWIYIFWSFSIENVVIPRWGGDQVLKQVMKENQKVRKLRRWADEFYIQIHFWPPQKLSPRTMKTDHQNSKACRVNQSIRQVGTLDRERDLLIVQELTSNWELQPAPLPLLSASSSVLFRHTFPQKQLKMELSFRQRPRVDDPMGPEWQGDTGAEDSPNCSKTSSVPLIPTCAPQPHPRLIARDKGYGAVGSANAHSVRESVHEQGQKELI